VLAAQARAVATRWRRFERRACRKGKHDVTKENLGDDCEVAVIGAGPDGLAVAVHLRSAKVGTRVFGRPMSFWREHMLKGMKLRSPWIATHIADPGKRFSLDPFAHQAALTRQDQLPIKTSLRAPALRRAASPVLRRPFVVGPATPGSTLISATVSLRHSACR
jgi:hypothetical protein